jgi:3'-phosphoadenosine 5'-phosphosulfate sulfotransferase (PAPS reductase)/FAD synthetase
MVIPVNKKVESAIALIKKYAKIYPQDIFLGHSGGKDSCVIQHLALTALNTQLPILHNPKGDTHPDTIAFLYKISKTTQVINVPSGLMQSVIGKSKMCQIDGTRRDEHSRDDRSTDLIIAGKNISRKDMPSVVENGIFGMTIIYPIYDWTDKEVWTYIKENDISVSAEYDVASILASLGI